MIKQMRVPEVGTIIQVYMPCDNWALAEVLWYYYRNHGYAGSHYLSNVIALRVRWLEAQDPYARGYILVWDRRIETTEGSVTFPVDPANVEYGHVQMGAWKDEY